MATRLKDIDRRPPMLLPPDLRDWLAENHLVHFIVEAIELLGVESYHLNVRGSGSEQ